MRYWVICGYWIGAVVLLALLLVSFDYDFGRALFIASSMLPGMLCAQFFLPRALAASCRRAVAVVCVAMGAVVVEWMSMLLAYRYTRVAGEFYEDFPTLFSNPVFLSILLAAFVLPGELLSRWLRQRLPRPDSIAFVSERRRVMLKFAAIVYVESNDSEVLLHAVDGAVYRTRTRISQWEQQLDDRFVRVHRAYIVNADHATEVSAQSVEVGGIRIEFSRKYRESAVGRLSRRV
ncbi:MAG: LytTR family transcriptional regulator [Alistipes sp.]|nr:LytTR family transcriptional regulator [Alistipes senegalensis]MCM1250725.1 LytTR family transcriptional regulator [Alistipes sp.]